MTRRKATVIAALTATLVVLVALAVRPLLPARHAAVSQPTTSPVILNAAPAVTPLAERAAAHALACPTQPRATNLPLRSAASSRWCGPLTFTRQQTTCSSPQRCTVELLGTVHTIEQPITVALTVTMRRTGSHWQLVEVTS